MKTTTKTLLTNYPSHDPYGALNMPIYQTASYEFATAADMAKAFTNKVKAPDYSRVMNPTVTFFENRVRSVTGAAHVTAFGSGMGAIANLLLSIASQGRTIISSPHLFGNTYSLLDKTLARFGVKTIFLDLTRPELVRQNITPQVCCIYLETVTNPQMEVADIGALAEIVHENGIPLVADTTMIPFTEYSAKSLGVDFEVVSTTKYISGGATSLGGVVIDYGTFPQINPILKQEMLFNVGGYMTPQAAYMQTLGLETLHTRYSRQAQTALQLANSLLGHPCIERVNYIGLSDNPYYTLARRQFGATSGAMFCIDLPSQDDCFHFIDSLRLVHRATNLFDSRTLAIHPATTIFGNFTPEQRNAIDVSEKTIRLSIGLEDPEDLLEDIIQALEK